MSKADTQGVQRETMQAVIRPELPVDGPNPITYIPNQRVARMLEVTSNLMQSAGLGGRLNQRKAARGGKATEVCDGWYSWTLLRARDRMIDDAFDRWCSSNQGEVGLVHIACLEGILQRARTLVAQREDQHAAGGSVQAVDWKDSATESSA